jgi:FkbM family methyltransferase
MKGDWLRAVIKMYLTHDSRSGRHAFRFVPRSISARFIEIMVRSKSGNFRSSVKLRRRTSDPVVFQDIFFEGAYNLAVSCRGNDIIQLYDAFNRAGEVPLILDLGANIGLASLYFSNAWPEARILAVEPSSDNIELTRQNTCAHPNIVPVHAAVSSSDGYASISNPGEEAWAYRTKRASASDGNTVRAVSIDTLLALAPMCKPFIAKIDIEGFEEDLFSANIDWVARFPIIVLEIHDWMIPRRAIASNFIRAVSRLNRDLLICGENLISVAN